jgi:hypothetical protein
MSDTPETDAEEDASHNFAELVVPSGLARRLERERDEAREKNAKLREIHDKAILAFQETKSERDEARDKLADWEDSAKHVRSEWPDEQHCSCVPILRKLLKDAERARDEAREELHKASVEANALATSIQKAEYSDAKEFELLGSVAGVISQIDNMYAGVRQQRDEARDTVEQLTKHGLDLMDANRMLKRELKRLKGNTK